MQSRPELSVVSPVYQAEACVAELCRRISLAAGELGISYEIVLVDDGSRDSSWREIENETRKRPGIVKGYRLSKNFGQHKAISAGLSFACGRYVIVMDCDLQDPPEQISHLYGLAVREKRDIILTRSATRHPHAVGSIGSRAFHWLLDLLRGEHFDPGIRSFSILSRNAVSAFLECPEYHRHYLSVLSVLGYRPQIIEIPSNQRFSGKSSYTIFKRFALAIDGITAHSSRLLYLAVFLGLIYGVAAFFFLVYVVYLGLTIPNGVPGWASAITVTLLTASVLCILLGIIGIYIDKIFYEVKRRPIYFVSETSHEAEGAQPEPAHSRKAAADAHR
jgi:polyisoprenyl-phosphate glycosyltransferase